MTYACVWPVLTSHVLTIHNRPEDEPFSLDTFGGPVQFLRFLRVSFEEEKGDVKGSKKLEVLRKKILQVRLSLSLYLSDHRFYGLGRIPESAKLGLLVTVHYPHS